MHLQHEKIILGIYHHKQYSYATLIDEREDVIRSGKMANLQRTLKKGNFASDDKIALLFFCL